MASPFSKDQLSQMNSALNKHLQSIGEYDHISSLKTFRPTNPLKFSTNSQSTNATTNISAFPSTHSQDPFNHPQYSLPLSSIDCHGFSIEEATSKGLKMQRELIKLHSKVLSLEKKITLIDTRTPQKKKASTRVHSRAPSMDPQDSTYLQMTNFTSLSITPRSPKGLVKPVIGVPQGSQKSKQSMHHRRASLPKQGLPSSQSKVTSPRDDSFGSQSFGFETRIRQQRRASLHVKPQKVSSGRKEKQSYRKEQQPEQQENTIRKYNVIDNSRIIEGDSLCLENGKITEMRTHSPMRMETLEYKGYQHDVYILNNQINQLKKEYEQDRNALKLEKRKGQELSNEVMRAGKRMENLGKRVEKVKSLGEDYQDLLRSFKKSEEIRNQQRDLIGGLNYEIILLKAEKENLNIEDKSLRGKKRTTSVKKRGSSQKKIGAKGL